MTIEQRINSLQKKISHKLFQFVISSVASSHVNETKSILNKDASLSSCIFYLLKNIAFSLFFIRKFSFGYKNKAWDCDTLIYFGNYKTKTEVEFLKIILNHETVQSIFISDSLNSNSDIVLERLNVPAFLALDYICDLSKLAFQLFSCLFKNKLSIYEFSVASLALKNLGVHYKWVGLIKNSRASSVVNFFSATTEGHALNYQSKSFGIKTLTYSWGSNAKSYEQYYSMQDVVMLKSKEEINKYRFGKEVIIGDIGLRIIKRITPLKFDICFIDTCYNDSFGLYDKIYLYTKIFKWLSTFEGIILHIVFHPGSVDLEVIEQLAKKYFIGVTSSKYNLDEVLAQSKLTVNINSTELKTAMYSKIPVVNFAPLFFDSYLCNLKPPVFLISSAGIDVRCFKQLNSFNSFSEVINAAFDEELYVQFLNENGNSINSKEKILKEIKNEML